ncbi:cysteine-rich secreted protein [Moniliophthora roreri]|nr:cysteine-rich secreted protein [Moniliophthora roreri]
MSSNGDRPVAKYHLHQWASTATTMIYCKVKRLASERGHCFVVVVWLSDFGAVLCSSTVYVSEKPNGLCCNPGEIIQDGKCAVPPPPPPPPPPGPSEGCPSQPNNACRLRKACGTGTANGLQYGSCYQITFSDGSGNQLGRGYTQDDNTAHPDVYVQRGWVSNIPYRICKSATDCGTGAVQSTDVFVIEDQIGPMNDAAGTKGWLNNAADPNFITITTAAAQAGKFKGKTSCSACKCVVSLTGDTRGLTLNGVLEPEERRQSGLGYRMSFRPNAGAAVTFEFAEVPCVAGPVLGKAQLGPVGNAAQVLLGI